INQFLTQEEIDYRATAFDGFSENYLPLNERRLECEQILNELADAFENSLKSESSGRKYLDSEFTNEKRQQYISEIIQRFSETHDYVGRVIKTFVQPSREKLDALNLFFEKTNPKILEPIKAYMKAKNAAPLAIMQSIL